MTCPLTGPAKTGALNLQSSSKRMHGLTPRQQQVLNFIQTRQASFGVAPSLREIAKEFGFRSMTAAADHVRALRRKGALVHHPRMARAHAVAPGFGAARPAPVAVSLLRRPSLSPDATEAKAAVASEVLLYVDGITPGLQSAESLFALDVKDNAWAGRHIIDGDMVVLDAARVPVPGDMVAVMDGDDYALKSYVVADSEICLRSDSSDNGELIPATGCSIKGVLVGVIRRFV
jgi:repressor LexA